MYFRRRMRFIILLITLLLAAVVFGSSSSHVAAHSYLPDSDGDGVPNIIDACPFVPGPAFNNGCPFIVIPINTPIPSSQPGPGSAGPDQDGDGVFDYVDQCPDQPGTGFTQGCPTSDGTAAPQRTVLTWANFERCMVGNPGPGNVNVRSVVPSSLQTGTPVIPAHLSPGDMFAPLYYVLDDNNVRWYLGEGPAVHLPEGEVGWVSSQVVLTNGMCDQTHDGGESAHVLYDLEVPVDALTFDVQPVCAMPLTFTVTATGAPLLVQASYTIQDETTALQAGEGVLDPLPAGGSTTLSLGTNENPYDSYTISVQLAGEPVLNIAVPPCALPTVAVQAMCGLPLMFTVADTSGAFYVDGHYEITDTADNRVVAVGSVGALSSGRSAVLSLTEDENPYHTYHITIQVAGETLFTQDIPPCALPVVSVEPVCGLSLAFTVTNSGSDLYVPASYTIVDTTDGSEAAAGTLDSLANGASATLSLTENANPYHTYHATLEVTGAELYSQDIPPCALPVISVESVCGLPLTFTVTNLGGSLYIPASYTIVDTVDGSEKAAGTLDSLAAGSSVSLALTENENPYHPYHVTIEAAGTQLYSQDIPPCASPVISVEAVCGLPLTFKVTNSGNDLYMPASYTIIDTTDDSEAAAGTLDTLASGASSEAHLKDTDSPYHTYHVVISVAGETLFEQDMPPCDPPVLAVEPVCGLPLTFTVTNSGNDLYMPASYTIIDTADDSEAAAGALDTLASGASATLSLTESASPYHTYHVVIGVAGETLFEQDMPPCDPPVLAVEPVCGLPLTFTVSNSGNDLYGPATYTIIDTADNSEAAAGTLDTLASGASATLSLTEAEDTAHIYHLVIDMLGDTLYAEDIAACEPVEATQVVEVTPDVEGTPDVEAGDRQCDQRTESRGQYSHTWTVEYASSYANTGGRTLTV